MRAVSLFAAAGYNANNLALLQCTSDYPAPNNQLNLSSLKWMDDTFDVTIGFSDHTNGVDAALLSLGMKARVFEKHFTYDRTALGPDHAASLEPHEMADYVSRLVLGLSAIGDGHKRCMPCEKGMRAISRKSFHAARDISAGEVLTLEDLKLTRPNLGVSAWDADKLIGKTIDVDIVKNSPMKLR